MKKNLLLNGIGAGISGLIGGLIAYRAASNRKYKQGFNDGANCILMIHSIDATLKEKEDLNKKGFITIRRRG